jgi:hypothetical protein
MKTFAPLFLAVGLYAQPQPAAPKKPAAAATEIAKASQAPAEEPNAKKGESLHYNVNWPSGLSLGEADLTSSMGDSSLNFTFRMDASVPGFAVSENVSSSATPEFCSIELRKQGTRGKRKIDERTEFDSAKLKATRMTEGGGKSELSTSPCAKDALAFVYFIRRELAAGRLPAQQKVYYGGAYGVHVTFAGTQQIPIGGEGVAADKLTATIKGPVTEITADLFFAKDASRTLLLVHVPLAVGKFSMELAR